MLSSLFQISLFFINVFFGRMPVEDMLFTVCTVRCKICKIKERILRAYARACIIHFTTKMFATALEHVDFVASNECIRRAMTSSTCLKS